MTPQSNSQASGLLAFAARFRTKRAKRRPLSVEEMQDLFRRDFELRKIEVAADLKTRATSRPGAASRAATPRDLHRFGS